MAGRAGQTREARGIRWRRLELAAATLSQFGASVTQQGTIVLGVFFATVYSLNLAQMGAVVSSLTLGWTCSGLFVGTLVDTYGPRRVLFVGTLLLSIVATAVAVTHSLPVTVVLLFTLGLALGTVPLSGTKAVLMAWPREQRGLPMGIRQMGVPVGALAAALILPTLAAHFGLHPLYWGFAALLGVCGLAFCAVLPRYERAPRRQARSASTTPLLRHEAGRLVLPAVSGFLLAWGQYVLLTYTIPLLHRDDGLSLTLAGFVLAVAQVGGAGGRILFGMLSDRLGGRRDPVLLGAALAATLLACVLAVLPGHVSALLLAPLWLVLGMTMVGWNALVLTWVGERVSMSNAGAAMGITTSAILLGATISAPIFGLIVQVGDSYRLAWLALAGVLGTAALLLWSQGRRESRRAEARTAQRPAIASQ